MESSRRCNTVLSDCNCTNTDEMSCQKTAQEMNLQEKFSVQARAASQQSFSDVSIWCSDTVAVSIDHCSVAECKLLNNRITICWMMNSLAQGCGWAFLQIPTLTQSCASCLSTGHWAPSWFLCHLICSSPEHSPDWGAWWQLQAHQCQGHFHTGVYTGVYNVGLQTLRLCFWSLQQSHSLVLHFPDFCTFSCILAYFNSGCLWIVALEYLLFCKLDLHLVIPRWHKTEFFWQCIIINHHLNGNNILT